jgi:hypothetical protein
LALYVTVYVVAAATGAKAIPRKALLLPAEAIAVGKVVVDGAALAPAVSVTTNIDPPPVAAPVPPEVAYNVTVEPLTDAVRPRILLCPVIIPLYVQVVPLIEYLRIPPAVALVSSATYATSEPETLRITN